MSFVPEKSVKLDVKISFVLLPPGVLRIPERLWYVVFCAAQRSVEEKHREEQ